VFPGIIWGRERLLSKKYREVKNKALFLDRDGVINIDKVYVHRKEDLEFVKGIFEVAKRYQDEGFLIFVITNQAGIARGLYTEEQFLELTEWMKERFAERGITITKVYYCPHHPDYGGECSCRKPNPGMILQAIEEYDIDPAMSVLIGDKESDIEAGKRAGIGRNILY
jgi:D-glycero-D-manno-heptose 1,7-bisphosphate phosphatase